VRLNAQNGPISLKLAGEVWNGARLEAATFFALVIWFITFIVIVPVGLAVALKEGLSWRGLRQISRGEQK